MKGMKTLSTCMIVKNEEPILRRCLDSVRLFSDEIVMVDTGSTDASAAIAREYTPKVYRVPWQDDFALARNASYGHASMDYVLWVDADNWIDRENANKLLRLKEELTDENSIFLLLQSDELMRPRWDHRITRRSPGVRWRYPVHEQLPVRTPVRWEPILIHHQSRRQVPPLYPRLLQKIPEREIFSQFWLCAQCYHDHLRCGQTEAAPKYLKKLLETRWAPEEYWSSAEDFGNVLFHWGYHREALIFYGMLTGSPQLRREAPLVYLRVLRHAKQCQEADKHREHTVGMHDC